MIRNKKILSIINTMRRMTTTHMIAYGVAPSAVCPVQHEDAVIYLDDMQHVLFMLDAMEEMVQAGRRDKWNRWLGWVQKTLQIHRVCSKEEMKILNKPDKKSPQGVVPTQLVVLRQVTDNLYWNGVYAGGAVERHGVGYVNLQRESKEALEQGLLVALNTLANEEDS